MKKIHRFLGNALVLIALLLTQNVSADEGMWMLNNIDPRTAAVMKDLGLQLTPQQLYNTDGTSLKDAVVDFGDFCSGVVVSPDGLVFTNHHCGYEAIQQLSTPLDDILANGFVARTRADERPAEGLFVRFLERTDDCTDRVMSAMKGLDNEKLDSVMQAVEEEYSDSLTNRYCVVQSFYGNSKFYVSIYKVYYDIRLVFTATETLGKFGGDTDNWMWPRQTCDFSVFRIYADANGEPAEYSKDNVPYHPKRYAKVSIDGYQPGDYCMTIGYPGSTDRYLSSYGINERVNGINVSMIDVRGKKQDVWKRWMDRDRSIGIKYSAKFAESSNYWKNSIGMNKAIGDLHVIDQKQELERNITEWYTGDSSLTERFGSMLDNLKTAYANRFEAIRALGYFTETFRRGIELNRAAALVQHLPADTDTVQMLAAKEGIAEFYKDYVPAVDEEVMAVLMDNYRQQVPAKYLPSCYQEVDSVYGGDTKAYAHAVYSNTILTDTSCVDKILADSTLMDTDPGLRFAASLSATRDSLYALVKEDRQTVDYNESLLTQAILERDQETPHYSDANFSMRLSYGFIQDYTAQGNHYDYYTNSQSLLDKAAKQDEIEDYKLEDNIMALIRRGNFGRYADKHTHDLHLCFLSNNDITGGNSGSPMFNGKGELIGLAFDGNWEAMSGDISFDSDLQRCIGVDIRFVLYLIDKWGHARNLLREMGL